MKRLNFNNPRRGKQPRANILLRWSRMARRKWVARSRAHLVNTLELAKRQAARLEALAAKYDVPMDPMPPIPMPPTLPGREWVEHLTHMRDLKPPVKPARTVQSEGAPA